MSQQSKKCLRSTGGAADPPAFFFCRLVFPGIDAWCVTVLFRNYSIPVLLAITCDYPTTVTYFHRIICAMSKLHAILDYTGYGHPSHHGNNIEKTWFVNPIKSVWIDWLPSPMGTYVFFVDHIAHSISSSAWTPDWAPYAIDDGLQSFETCGADVNVQFSNVLQLGAGHTNTSGAKRTSCPLVWGVVALPPKWYTTSKCLLESGKHE